MQVAATRSLGRRSEAGVGTKRNSLAMRSTLEMDVERAITTVAHADIGFALGSDTEIAPRERDEAVSRALNVVLAAIGLVVLAPVFVLVALAIKLTSRGPV